MNISYFDIFPDAKLKVTPKSQDEFTGELSPYDVCDLVNYLCSHKPPIRWLTIEHDALCKRVFVLIFDGLDKTRFCKYRSELPAFSSISKNGFPLTVLAEEKRYLIEPAVKTFLGYSFKSKKMKKYSSYEEMLASLNQRYDNGYPIEPGTELPLFSRPCRYTYFKMQPLSLEELTNFKKLPDEVKDSLDVIGIDCEMIKTSKGEEVARLSAVNENCDTIIDEYLKPIGEVEDYRTKYSGITEELLSESDDKKLFSSDQCCEILSKVADKHTIIIGHSLENDLRAMRIIHDRVIDTSLIYNTETRYPNKPALSKLYIRYISKNFRVDSENKGHDSVEDARASLLLAKYAMTAEVTEIDTEPKMPTFFTKIIGKENKSHNQQNSENHELQDLNSHKDSEDQNQDLEQQNSENQQHLEDQHLDNQNELENHEHLEDQHQDNQDELEHQKTENNENLEDNQNELENQNPEDEIPKYFKELKKSNAYINVFGPVFHVTFSGIDDRVNCKVGATVEEVIDSFLNSLNYVDDIPTLTYAYFHSLSHCELVDEEEIEACKTYNNVLEKTLEKVPPQSAIIIYTANGNLKRLRSNTSRARPGHDAERLKEFKQCKQGLLWVVCKNHDDDIE